MSAKAAQAVDFARRYLARDAGNMFAVSAEARTLAKTITILARSVRDGGDAADEHRRLIARLLGAADELGLVEACQLLVKAVRRAGSEGGSEHTHPASPE